MSLGKRILVADDDAELVEELAECLQAEGYVVDTALNGLVARARLAGNTYDVVLLDYKLPDATGAELLGEVERKNPGASVIFVSGKTDLEKLVRARPSKLVKAFLAKPFSIEVLLQKIKQSL